MNNFSRRSALTKVALACVPTLFTFPMNALASDDYPSRRFTFMVPYGAGGATDTLARAVGNKVSQLSGQPVVVDNRAGANTAIGTAAAVRSAPDGYTVLVVSSSVAIDVTLRPNLPYQAVRDLIPVTSIGGGPQLFLVSASDPVNTLKEFVAKVRKNPGKMNFSVSGSGSSPHLTYEKFRSITGIDMLVVPYKTTPDAARAIIAGEGHLLVDSLAGQAASINGGRLKVLAVTGAQRSPALPNVPTVTESGFPGMEEIGWDISAYVPVGTPTAIVEKLQAILAKAIADPAVTRTLETAGIQPGGESTRERKRLFDRDVLQWQRIIREAKIPTQE